MKKIGLVFLFFGTMIDEQFKVDSLSGPRKEKKGEKVKQEYIFL